MSETETAPVERIAARPGGAPLLIVVDHASNRVPPELGDLGLSEAERARHIAYDIGVRAVGLRLAERLGAAAVFSTFSRLVIDPNRGPDDPTLIMRIADRAVVEGNRVITPQERARRIAAYYAPYHRAVEEEAAKLDAATNGSGLLFSLHSYTPHLAVDGPRPWGAAVIWDRRRPDADRETPARLLDLLRQVPDLVVGENEPYADGLPGDTIARHGADVGRPHVLLELRNDLIATPTGQDAWAETLAPLLRIVADDARPVPRSAAI